MQVRQCTPWIRPWPWGVRGKANSTSVPDPGKQGKEHLTWTSPSITPSLETRWHRPCSAMEAQRCSVRGPTTSSIPDTLSRSVRDGPARSSRSLGALQESSRGDACSLLNDSAAKSLG